MAVKPTPAPAPAPVPEETEKERKKREKEEKKAAKKNSKKKKKKKGKAKVILILLFVVALGAAAALYYFRIIPDYLRIWALVEVDSERLRVEQTSDLLNQREAELTEWESELSEREAAVTERENEADSQTDAVEPVTREDFEKVVKGLSTEKETEIQQMASIYSKMDAAAAAEIMAEMYTTQDIALIVYYMRPVSAADVLAQMDAELAAEVTTLVVATD